jgi:hypothetical protein
LKLSDVAADQYLAGVPPVVRDILLRSVHGPVPEAD